MIASDLALLQVLDSDGCLFLGCRFTKQFAVPLFLLVVFSDLAVLFLLIIFIYWRFS